MYTLSRSQRLASSNKLYSERVKRCVGPPTKKRNHLRKTILICSVNIYKHCYILNRLVSGSQVPGWHSHHFLLSHLLLNNLLYIQLTSLAFLQSGTSATSAPASLHDLSMASLTKEEQLRRVELNPSQNVSSYLVDLFPLSKVCWFSFLC